MTSLITFRVVMTTRPSAMILDAAIMTVAVFTPTVCDHINSQSYCIDSVEYRMNEIKEAALTKYCLLFVSAEPVPEGPQCAVSSSEKVGCDAIYRDDCLDIGCCWYTREFTPGAPWCYSMNIFFGHADYSVL